MPVQQTGHSQDKSTRQRRAPRNNPAPLQSPLSAESPQLIEAANPRSTAPTNLLSLQRSAGNRAVQRRLTQTSPLLPIQTKLTVGPANDLYEQEADRVANQVMRSPVTTAAGDGQPHPEDDRVQLKPLAAAITPVGRSLAARKTSVQRHFIQRHAGHTDAPVASEEEEEPGEVSVQRSPLLQRKPLGQLIQRHATSKGAPPAPEEEELPEEEEQIQRKPSAQQASEAGFETDHSFENALSQQQGGGNALAGDTRAFMEQRFGTDFGNVRVHSDSDAAHLNRQVQAQAFTHQSDIYFGSGMYNPGTEQGKHLLAHELTHVVQQGGARPSPQAQRVSRKAAPVRGVIQRWNPVKKIKNWWKNAYNVRMGGQLPNVREMGVDRLKDKLGQSTSLHEKAAEYKLDQAMKLLRDEHAVDEILLQAQEDAETKKKPVPTNNDKLDFRLEFGNIVAEAPSWDEAFKAYAKIVRGTIKSGLLNFFSIRVGSEAEMQLRDSPDLPQERRLLGPGLKLNDAMDRFLQERQGVQLEQAYLTAQQKPPFATALKQMPTVKFILKQGGGQEGEQVQPGEAAWKDGGSLVDSIVKVNDFWKLRKLFNWMFDSKRAQKRLNSRTFRGRVEAVDKMMKAMVAPEILVKIPKPAIHVHATAAQSFAAVWGFRAWASGGKELHVAYNEDTNVIAHEVGHIIEEYLPMEIWHDIHLLLGARHQAGGGGTARAGATPLFTSFTEGRYAGNYVTGKYTSTAYKGGNAEVVSMAMQFFSSPEDALRLIDGDPLHAAIVLRGLKPEEYQSTDALRAYDKFLPHA